MKITQLLTAKLSQWVDSKPNSNILNKKYCPICKSFSKSFGNYGVDNRANAMCFHCGSLERHRLTWLYFERMTNLFNDIPKRVLHVAPEKCFEKRLVKLLGDDYFSVDINSKIAMMRTDVTRIQFKDEAFDVIYCCHVLEHVINDKTALLEFYRILKSDGWAILIVPIEVQKTLEDPDINDPARRLQLFGQEDHVRRYGLDYINRLQDSGFNVKRISASEFLTQEEILRMGITPAAGDIYYCTKI